LQRERRLPGRIEWNEEENASAKAAQTVVLGNELGLQFDGAGKPSRLDARQCADRAETVAGAEKQTATAKNGFMELQPAGGWLRMELNENVKLNEGNAGGAGRSRGFCAGRSVSHLDRPRQGTRREQRDFGAKS